MQKDWAWDRSCAWLWFSIATTRYPFKWFILLKRKCLISIDLSKYWMDLQGYLFCSIHLNLCTVAYFRTRSRLWCTSGFYLRRRAWILGGIRTSRRRRSSTTGPARTRWPSSPEIHNLLLKLTYLFNRSTITRKYSWSDRFKHSNNWLFNFITNQRMFKPIKNLPSKCSLCLHCNGNGLVVSHTPHTLKIQLRIPPN